MRTNKLYLILLLFVGILIGVLATKHLEKTSPPVGISVVDTIIVELSNVDCFSTVDSLWQSCLVDQKGYAPYYNTSKFGTVLDSLRKVEEDGTNK